MTCNCSSSGVIIIRLWDIGLSIHEVTSVIAAIIPACSLSHPVTAPCFCLHPDPKQPFFRRDAKNEDIRNGLETILIRHSTTHVIVPCLVTVPDLNVTLYAVCVHHRFLILLNIQLKLSSDVWIDNLIVFFFFYVSSQYPSSLDNSQMKWDNKRGWSIPRQLIDSAPMIIGVLCLATLEGEDFQSANYLIHTTGKLCLC